MKIIENILLIAFGVSFAALVAVSMVMAVIVIAGEGSILGI